MLCSICKELCTTDSRQLKAKGIEKIIYLSKSEYKDDIDKQFKDNEKYYVHNNCYKKYTGASYIKAAKHQANSSERVLGGRHRLRSEKTAFSYQFHCLICTEELLVIDTRHPDRQAAISSIEMVSNLQCGEVLKYKST